MIVVPGRPIPKGRPRLGIRGRSTFIYTPIETSEYEKVVGLCTNMAMKTPKEGPVEITIRVFLRAGGRGDIDNYVKSVLDGMNRIAFQDDHQVLHVDARIVKCKAEEERVEIEVRDYEEPQKEAAMS